MTIYRTAEQPRIIESSSRRRENGKQVAVVVELKARFDESANIRWDTDGHGFLMGSPHDTATAGTARRFARSARFNSGPVKNVVTSAIKTIIAKMGGGGMPRS